jgi:hypothetical protein
MKNNDNTSGFLFMEPEKGILETLTVLHPGHQYRPRHRLGQALPVPADFRPWKSRRAAIPATALPIAGRYPNTE